MNPKEQIFIPDKVKQIEGPIIKKARRAGGSA
jgi:hypothetical protein